MSDTSKRRQPRRDQAEPATIARLFEIANEAAKNALLADGPVTIEQDFKLPAVAGFAPSQMDGKGQAVKVGLEVDLGRKPAARATECLAMLPPLAPAAETCARTTVLSHKGRTHDRTNQTHSAATPCKPGAVHTWIPGSALRKVAG